MSVSKAQPKAPSLSVKQPEHESHHISPSDVFLVTEVEAKTCMLLHIFAPFLDVSLS